MTKASTTRSTVVFTLNGVLQYVSGEQAFLTLAEFLRYQARLVGTKIVCAEGDCGACSVLLARQVGKERPDFISVNACIMLVAQVDGAHVVTVEGLAYQGKLAPAQEALVKCHGSQCGYCTPGFAVTMTWMLCQKEEVTPQAAKNSLTGNLCRCTGYEPIIAACTEAAALRDADDSPPLHQRFLTATQIGALKKACKLPLQIHDAGGFFSAPTSPRVLMSLRKKYPQATLLGAGTDLGVQRNKGKRTLNHILSLQAMASLYDIKKQGGRLWIGARVTLAVLRRYFEPSHPSLADTLNLFASPQIKNVATLVGNIANASPIADTVPVLLALDAQLEVWSLRGTKRKVALADFYLGYKVLNLKAGEVIAAVSLALPKANETIRFYKSSTRKDLDISAVSFALWAKRGRHGALEDLRIGAGGLAATPLRLYQTENALRGKVCSDESAGLAARVLLQEVTPISDGRGSAEFRKALSANILRELVAGDSHG